MKSTNILLFIVILLCGAIGYYTFKMSEEVKQLKEQVEVLTRVSEQKLDSLILATAQIAAKSTKTTTSKKQSQPKSFWEDLFSALDEDSNKQASSTRATSKPKMTVSSSYRLEDRYVSYKVRLPEYVGDQEGKVVVYITVDYSGKVRKTSVGSETTIVDEEVIEASRKAALQTDFNYSSGAQPQEGKITYTFKKQ